jgi:DNA-binding SARP family transcriptional activator
LSRLPRQPIAKITRPLLRDIVARPRLFATLASASPLVWVSAAPGAGKTSLAASYCESSGARALWYQVDAGDADPATFFHFMRQVAAQASPASAAKLPALPPESGVDLAVFARQFFRIFFSMLPAPATWVIDNFQDAGEPGVAFILREACEQIPPGVAVIVLSHADPPPAFARLTANGRIRCLGTDDLRFTRAESDDVIVARLGADALLLSTLHERSSGWAAGLVLMIEDLRRAGARGVPSVDESQAAVFDYFAALILADCTPAEQRTLMLTATLPRVTPRLVEAMCGRADAGALLERLHSRHLFLDRHSASEPSYQYHRLFKVFLTARARDALSAEEQAEAANRAAALLELEGNDEDAIVVYLSAHNWDSVARLTLQHARRLQEEGRWRTLLDWVSALPPALLEEQPWLSYWAGACQVWSDAPLARRSLERAFHRFVALDDVGGQILAAGALTRACILDTHWLLLDKWIGALQTLLCGDTTAVGPDVMLTGLSRLTYVTLARNPQHPQLAAWASWTHELLGAPVEEGVAVMAGYSLLFYFTWAGRSTEGEQVVRRIAPLANDARLSLVSQAHWLFAHANYVLRFGDPGDALALMDRALAIAAGNGITIEGVIRRHRIAHLLTIGRLGDAESELGKLAQAPRIEPYFELRAWLAWRQGQLAVALDEAEAALRLATERGRTIYRILDLLLLAEIAATSGDVDSARAWLQSYREATAHTPGEFFEFQALLIEAQIEFVRGAKEAGCPLLRQALAIGSQHRYRSFWGWSPKMMTPLLSEALAHDIAVDYSRELIRIHHLTPATPDIKHWPWPVRIRTLGRFEIELDGVVLRSEGKVQRKPLMMLKILIAAGERVVAIEELIGLLWSGPDDGGRKAFDITVHRLRKLLACEAGVVVADRHATLDPRFVWIDAWALDRLLDSLVPVIGSPAPVTALEAAAPRVLELFGGMFLAGEPEVPWALAMRHRMTGRTQRFAAHLGSHWEASKQWVRAGELYQWMIELDPLAESFYRRHMICLQAQARRAEAIEVFRRCRHMLSTRLGIAPGQDTEKVYQELVAS